MTARTWNDPDPECGGDYGTGTGYCVLHDPRDGETCRQWCEREGEQFVPLPFCAEGRANLRKAKRRAKKAAKKAAKERAA